MACMDCVNVQTDIRLGKRNHDLIVLVNEGFIQIGACAKHLQMLKSIVYSKAGIMAAIQHDLKEEAIEKKVTEIIAAHAWVENTTSGDKVSAIQSENFENFTDAIVDYIMSLKGEANGREE